MSALPPLSVSIDCGSCGAAVEHDGDQYVCFDCGLVYDTDPFSGDQAWFLDEELPPCGDARTEKPWTKRKPFRTVNGVVKVWRNWTFRYQPCPLPAGHKSSHDHNIEASYTEETT